MSSSVSSVAARTPRVILVAWVLIAIKCLLVVWAVERWQVPVHAGWVVWPTIAFGALATLLWAGQRQRD
jgi:hypothetical protein